MSLKAILPAPAEIGREAIILICGALIAAVIMSNWPAGRSYIRSAWGEPGSH